MVYIAKYYKDVEVSFMYRDNKEEFEIRVHDLPQEGLQIRYNPHSYIDYCNQTGHGSALALDIMLGAYFKDSNPL